jgi:cytochrome c oxidase subunit IV
LLKFKFETPQSHLPDGAQYPGLRHDEHHGKIPLAVWHFSVGIFSFFYYLGVYFRIFAGQ